MSSIKTALIDGDILVYSSAFSAEKFRYDLHLVEGEDALEFPAHSFLYRSDLTSYIQENNVSSYEVRSTLLVEPIDHALHNLKTIISSIKDKTKASNIKIFLSGKENYRNSIATFKKYKGNRDGSRIPTHKEAITDYLLRIHKAIVVDKEEADDALGIEQCSSPFGSTIICSSDKDLLQIPGHHFRLTDSSVVIQDSSGADKHFYCQVMAGDSTDNIVGCPSVGPAGARKFYDPDNPWQSVLSCYRTVLSKKYLDDLVYDESRDTVTYTVWHSGEKVTKPLVEFVIEQARLVRIRRKQGEYWSPDE